MVSCLTEFIIGLKAPAVEKNSMSLSAEMFQTADALN
jgi:hypothetical protein